MSSIIRCKSQQPCSSCKGREPPSPILMPIPGLQFGESLPRLLDRPILLDLLISLHTFSPGRPRLAQFSQSFVNYLLVVAMCTLRTALEIWGGCGNAPDQGLGSRQHQWNWVCVARTLGTQSFVAQQHRCFRVFTKAALALPAIPTPLDIPPRCLRNSSEFSEIAQPWLPCRANLSGTLTNRENVRSDSGKASSARIKIQR